MKSTQLVCLLRIAILRSTLHEGSGQMIHISALTKGLKRLGHEVTVFSREVETKDRSIFIQEMGFLGDNVSFFRNFVFPFRCLPSLEEFDIVHTQYHPGIFVGNVAKKVFMKPHVFTYHGFAPVRIWKNFRQQIR